MNHANQTKLMLTQSLQDLMLHTPLEKISVQDIVDHAGVGRNTFYYHFADKYDLVNWYFQDTATRFLVERQAFTDWTSMLRAVEAYFRAHKVFYQNALSYNGQNSLQEYIFEFCATYTPSRSMRCCRTPVRRTGCASGGFYRGPRWGCWCRGCKAA